MVDELGKTISKNIYHLITCWVLFTPVWYVMWTATPTLRDHQQATRIHSYTFTLCIKRNGTAGKLRYCSVHNSELALSLNSVFIRIIHILDRVGAWSLFVADCSGGCWHFQGCVHNVNGDLTKILRALFRKKKAHGNSSCHLCCLWW